MFGLLNPEGRAWLQRRILGEKNDHKTKEYVRILSKMYWWWLYHSYPITVQKICWYVCPAPCLSLLFCLTPFRLYTQIDIAIMLLLYWCQFPHLLRAKITLFLTLYSFINLTPVQIILSCFDHCFPFRIVPIILLISPHKLIITYSFNLFSLSQQI